LIWKKKKNGLPNLCNSRLSWKDTLSKVSAEKSSSNPLNGIQMVAPSEILFILKWGGELTHSGVEQAI